MHAHNTFENPDAVKPASLDVSVSDGILSTRIPVASVVKVDIAMG